MATELHLERLHVALRSINEFAARDLPDSPLIEVDERDGLPEVMVPRVSCADELGALARHTQRPAAKELRPKPPTRR